MRKLTIGSLKYGLNYNSTEQTVMLDDKLVEKTNRIVEIVQNQMHYQLHVATGQSMLEASLEQGVALDYKCQKGTCGKCKVKVENGRSILAPANDLEEKRLHYLINNGYRLACQARAK